MINWRTAEEKPNTIGKIYVLFQTGRIVDCFYKENGKILNCYNFETSVKKWCYESDLIKDAEGDVCECKKDYAYHCYKTSCGGVMSGIYNKNFCPFCGKKIKINRD